MRRAAKVDSNHGTIVAAFKAHGCSVRDNSAAGNGLPDLAVGFLGVTHLVEVKDGKKAPSKRKRTPAQVKWAEDWKGEPPVLVESIDDVAACVARWRLHGPDAVGTLAYRPNLPWKSREEELAEMGALAKHLPMCRWPDCPYEAEVNCVYCRGHEYVKASVAPSDVEVDPDDYNGRPRVVVHGGLIQRREVRVTPNVVRAKGGA